MQPVVLTECGMSLDWKLMGLIGWAELDVL